MRFRTDLARAAVAGAVACLCLALASMSQGEPASPEIEFTQVPTSGGGPDRLETIAGRVQSADPSGYRLVIYARTDRWYVQPFVRAPFTRIGSDGSWQTRIHLGVEYAALLVEPTWDPPATLRRLPKKGGPIAAVAVEPARP